MKCIHGDSELPYLGQLLVESQHTNHSIICLKDHVLHTLPCTCTNISHAVLIRFITDMHALHSHFCPSGSGPVALILPVANK